VESQLPCGPVECRKRLGGLLKFYHRPVGAKPPGGDRRRYKQDPESQRLLAEVKASPQYSSKKPGGSRKTRPQSKGKPAKAAGDEEPD
jgi:hypothetical protein